MKIRVIITGVTGMVGEGVLYECLNHPEVESVLTVTRRSSGIQHEKLTEVVHNDFFNFIKIKDKLSGFNACFFCLGTTSVGKNQEEYDRITFQLTSEFADTLLQVNPGMTFCYVSGSGTDSTERGKIMWARIKGKTENYLLPAGFKDAYMFRPALILPTKGLSNTLTMYKIFAPVLPLVKLVLHHHVCTLKQIGLAMINSVIKGYDKKILEVEDIKRLAYN